MWYAGSGAGWASVVGVDMLTLELVDLDEERVALWPSVVDLGLIGPVRGI